MTDHRAPRRAFGLALAALFLSGCGGDGDSEAAPQMAPGYDVALALEWESTNTPAADIAPDALDFTLLLLAGETSEQPEIGLIAVVGMKGASATTELLQATEDDTWRITDVQIMLFDYPPWSVFISELVFTARDEDGDGVVDHLTGNAFGAVNWFVDGNSGVSVFEATLDGRPDSTPPSLVFERDPTAQQILEPLRLYPSEPLPLDVEAQVRMPTTGAVLDLVPRIDPSGVITRFTLPQIGALPFASDLTVEFPSGLRDWAGVAGDPNGYTARTVADPGLFAEDGFVGPLSAHLLGESAVIDQLCDVPSWSGTRMLYIPPDSSAVLQIPVQPGERLISIHYRAIASEFQEVPWLPATFEMAAIGAGSIQTDQPFVFDSGPDSVNQPERYCDLDGQTLAIGYAQEHRVPIPIAADDVVIVSIEADLEPIGSSLLIDDIQVF